MQRLSFGVADSQFSSVGKIGYILKTFPLQLWVELTEQLKTVHIQTQGVSTPQHIAQFSRNATVSLLIGFDKSLNSVYYEQAWSYHSVNLGYGAKDILAQVQPHSLFHRKEAKLIL